MGAGGVFTPGQSKKRPGKYISLKNTGGTPISIKSGVVAVAFLASWGPMGLYPGIGNKITQDMVDNIYFGGNVDDVKDAFEGGALEVIPYRVGTGGAKALKNLLDSAAAQVVKIEALYIGNETINIAVQDSLADATKKELIVYHGTREVERFAFTKAATEPAGLVAAVTEAGSNWITATKLADGNNTVSNLGATALTGGTNPAVVAADYTTAMNAVEKKQFNAFVADTIDTAVHAAIKIFIQRLFNEGKRAVAFVGENTSVALETRLTNCKAFNSFVMHYALNGFKDNLGVIREGHRAAAWFAGLVAGAPYNDSITGYILTNAVEIIGELANGEIEAGIDAGALMFTTNETGDINVEYGINTLNTINDTDELDEGWKKIRRVKTRFELIERILKKWATYKIDNDPDGQKTHIANANGIIGQMVKEGGLLDGAVALDPLYAPAGDSAWFKCNVLDLDNCEKQYITFGFQY